MPTTRRPHVVAVLPDSAEAVSLARAAAQVALERNQPLALVVPVPLPGFTINALLVAHRLTRVEADALAIAGRVRPVLDALRVPAAVHAAPYRALLGARFTSSSRASVVRDLVRALEADTVIVESGSSLRAGLGPLAVPAICPLGVQTEGSLASQPRHDEGVVFLGGAR